MLSETVRVSGVPPSTGGVSSGSMLTPIGPAAGAMVVVSTVGATGLREQPVRPTARVAIRAAMSRELCRMVSLAGSGVSGGGPVRSRDPHRSLRANSVPCQHTETKLTLHEAPPGRGPSHHGFPFAACEAHERPRIPPHASGAHIWGRTPTRLGIPRRMPQSRLVLGRPGHGAAPPGPRGAGRTRERVSGTHPKNPGRRSV